MKSRFAIGCLLFISPFTFVNAYFYEENIEIQGYLYFNASQAGFQGERYLLNQQVTSLQMRVDWKMFEWSKLHAVFVYNPWPSPLYPTFYFDELYNQFHLSQSIYTNVGRQWIPFGNYRSDLIYKPFTKTLGQTNEDALLLGFENHSFYANVSIFRPHTEMINAFLPAYYNINIGAKNDNYDVGFSYIYSIAETQLFRYDNGFGGFIGEKIKSHVPGIASYINYHYKKINVNLSYVSALKKFNLDDLSFDGEGAKPGAFSIQSGYQFNIKTIPAKIIGFYDISSEALALGLPKTRAGVGLNLYPYKYIDLSLQCFKDYAYPGVQSSAKVYNTMALQVLLHF